MPYIFRLETTVKANQLPEPGRKALFREMKKGRLRQGWGRDGANLLDGHGKPLPRDQWVKNYRASSRETVEKVRRHFTLLSPMLNIRPGDLIVVPNFAEDGWDGLVMAKAVASHSGRKGPGECYDFSSSVPDELDGDRRHFVAIDPLFKPIPLNKQGQHLKKLIKDGKYRVRVRKVNGELHPELLRTIAKLADADLIEETQTIKNAKVAKPPSDEQRERGRKGEDEVERRLRLKGGFEGFTFVKNRTKDRCGYDFLARHKNREVEIEVKSFDAKVGLIFLTEKEFERAQENPKGYHLWVLLDNGDKPETWALWMLPSPYSQLQKPGIAEPRATIVYRVVPLSLTWGKKIAGS